LHVPQSCKTYTSAPIQNGHDYLSRHTLVMSKELYEYEPTFSNLEINWNLENDDIIEMLQNNESSKEKIFEVGYKTWKESFL
jgi:hypothetical protein